MSVFEFHCHSNASDGSFSPRELIEKAAATGLSGLCLTDHDTDDGCPEAQRLAKKLGLQFAYGIEIEIDHPSEAFHLLGLGYDPVTESLRDMLPRVREYRRARNMRIAKKMNMVGVPGGYGDVEALANGGVVGRPHFAQYLIQKGFASDGPDAFQRFLGHGQCMYERKRGIELSEAVQRIHAAGGIAVVAHPASLRLSWTKLREEAKIWSEIGVDGIEAYHSGVKLNDGKRYRAIADELGFLTTAGSDFHRDEPGKKLGRGCVEQLPINEKLVPRAIQRIFGS